MAKFAGEDEAGVADIKLSSLFSGVFKKHTKQQAEELFTCGTSRTTPNILDIDANNEAVKPWLFSRVLMWLVLAFVLLCILTLSFHNEKPLVALIMVGAIAVPVAGIVFFFEVNVLRDISFFTVMKICAIGGIFSLLVTLVLYEVTGAGRGDLSLTDALSVGLVEELGKMAVVAYFVYRLHARNVLQGLLIGASVGAGFAAIETAGYILDPILEVVAYFGIQVGASGDKSAMQDFGAIIDQAVQESSGLFLKTAFVRAWSAVGGHLIWAAMVGAGLVLAVRALKRFSAACFVKPQFLVFFGVAVALHTLWDWNISYSDYKLIALIIAGWAVILPLISIGLKEISMDKALVLPARRNPQ